MDKKKRFNFSNKQKITLFSLLAILALIISVGGFFVFRFYNHSYEAKNDPAKVNVVDEDIKFTEVPGITNILLLSSDARPGEDVSRSDSIMILTIDNIHKKLKVTSLMRDMLVEIDGHGEEKLNHAFAYGGPTKTIETIQNNFGIKLDNYVIVDFSGFVKVIDAIGGIEVTIKDYELDELNKYIIDGGGSEKDLLPTPGTYNLNGYQALSYARIRKVGDGEYERTERQRAVIQLALEKVKDMSPVKLVALLNELFPYVKTNISLGDAMNYGFTALNVGKQCNFEIEQFRIPLDSISKGGIIDNKGWVFVIDTVETSKALQEFIFNDNKDYEPDTSNFNSIIDKCFNSYDIKDDTSHPDYEYIPNSNTNGNFENNKKSSSNNNNNSNSSNNSSNKVEKPTNKPNTDNGSNKPTTPEKPNIPVEPETPQEKPATPPTTGSGNENNNNSSDNLSNGENQSSDNVNTENNT
ncbi:LCP family protein [Clostridium sp. LIBA-8841]|uniref:LCP family protein n=1 Tax=Clostridium sp. LIBA-8841 TaxID=2987530 RepID=UPI002AC5D8B5|nr:LCP family protein [Clostridium sp. LIBA-8841]MDZ5252857.1 LCP family protein [Clostridium sp. LIBA-8841]